MCWGAEGTVAGGQSPSDQRLLLLCTLLSTSCTHPSEAQPPARCSPQVLTAGLFGLTGHNSISSFSSERPWVLPALSTSPPAVSSLAPVLKGTTTQRFSEVNTCLPEEAWVPEGLGLSPLCHSCLHRADYSKCSIKCVHSSF